VCDKVVCVTKWSVTKLCVTKMVCDKIVCVTGGGGVGGGGREEERTGGGADGIQKQKQEPHTKMWGTTQSLHVFLLRWAIGVTNWLVTGDLLPSKNPNEIIHGY
jgi:hypothetical protein